MSLTHHLVGPETAPVLVLSSSIGTTSELWDAQLPDLLPRFRVLRFDHPGHGASPLPAGPLTVEGIADSVLGLLDELEIARVSFCGLSLGGMVGIALSLAAPSRIERLVLACTAAYLGPPEGWRERARLVRRDGMEAIADSVLARWFTSAFRSAEPETVARFRQTLVSSSPEGYAACCDAIAAWDARERLHDIGAPTLVVVGADDPVTTLEHAAPMGREIRGARIVTLPAAAHLANVEQPEAFNRALLGHLDVDLGTEEAA